MYNLHPTRYTANRDEPVRMGEIVQLLLARYGIDPLEIRQDEPRRDVLQMRIEFTEDQELVGHC